MQLESNEHFKSVSVMQSLCLYVSWRWVITEKQKDYYTDIPCSK